MNKFLIISIIIIFSAKLSYAQDFVLSQPFASNQFLTPGGVGAGAYQSRLQGIMKAQMIDGNNLYRTYVVGYDTRFKAADENSKNYLGIGGQFMSDQVMNGVMQSNFLVLDLAYHIFLNKDLSKSFSIGFGTAFAQTTLNKSNLFFADQFDQAAGYTGNASMENLMPFPASLSANTGIVYTQHSENAFLQAGATGFFFAKPNLTYSSTNSAPETKFRYFINLEIPFLEQYSIALHANVLNKKLNNQYYAGGAIGLPLDHDYEKAKRLYLGCYYRKGEAIVPSVSLMSDKYIAGVSYEIYNSNISGANVKLSSFEFTISKSFGNKKTDLYRTIFD